MVCEACLKSALTLFETGLMWLSLSSNLLYCKDDFKLWFSCLHPNSPKLCLLNKNSPTQLPSVTIKHLNTHTYTTFKNNTYARTHTLLFFLILKLSICNSSIGTFSRVYLESKALTRFTSLSLPALFLSPECLPEAAESCGHLRTSLRFIFHLRVSEAYARHLHADNHKSQKQELELRAVVGYHVGTGFSARRLRTLNCWALSLDPGASIFSISTGLILPEIPYHL